MLKLIAHKFIRSKRVKARTSAELERLYMEGYNVGNTSSDGGVYMVKPCQAIIVVETSSGTRFTQDMRGEICRFYGKKSLRLERFNLFLSELLTGKVELRLDIGEIRICRVKH